MKMMFSNMGGVYSAPGSLAHAEGFGNTAIGNVSHAEGFSASACSHNADLAASASSIVLEHESDLVSVRPEAFKVVYCRDTGFYYLGTSNGDWILVNVQNKLEIVDYNEDTTINNT